MNEQIKREEGVHGTRWGAVHGGYFSDPAVAAPLVEAVREGVARSGAKAVVDLGGGNGFLLSRLRAAGIGAGALLVNLDDSSAQIEAARAAGFSCVRGGVDSFARGDVVPEGARGLFTMRSVLHYFGESGLGGALRHVREQAREGELFIHQTAAFRRGEDAECLNELYREMGTGKWYASVDELRRRLEGEGWRVEEELPAAPLRLTSGDLAQRYHLGDGEVRRIGEGLSRRVGTREGVFEGDGSGFQAFLHYWIFVCSAKGGA